MVIELSKSLYTEQGSSWYDVYLSCLTDNMEHLFCLPTSGGIDEFNEQLKKFRDDERFTVEKKDDDNYIIREL